MTVRRPSLAAAAAAVGLLVLAACSGPGRAGGGDRAASWAPREERVGGLLRLASTEGDRLVLRTEAGDVDFVPGVNVGVTVPGRYPGEMAVPAEEYRRWFRDIGALGLRAVRVYTVHPPAFYDELSAYNRSHPSAPLYLVQGVHLPEDGYVREGDLFAPSVHDAFRAELTHASRAVHGGAERTGGPGSAGGRWRADVSAWLLAYLVGSELDPAAVQQTDRRNAERPGVTGRYFTSRPGASATERWMAGMLDHLAAEEAGRGRTMPLAFVNWATTDPLAHPDEPDAAEDLVGVDANNVVATPAWPGGHFASYHAYPYYPDFLRHETGLVEYRHRGRPDPYAGYLAALKAHHRGMPVVISEFGVPSSVGSAHRGPLGRDQGGHAERDAMAIDAELLRTMADLGLAGGFVFEWQDEWFKQTWNTRDRQLPAERRALWHDAWTNEQHFGLQAVDPAGGEAPRVVHEGDGAVRELRVGHDEGYLHLVVRLADEGAAAREVLAVGFDVVPGGAAGLPDRPGVGPDADTAVTVAGGAAGQVWVRASNDPFALVDAGRPAAVGGPAPTAWNPARLVVNRAVRAGDRLVRPAEHQEVGRLVEGVLDPSSPAFDGRAAWTVDGAHVRLRLPWAAVGMSDPSSRRALAVSAAGRTQAVPLEQLNLTVALGDEAVTASYRWEPWDSVRWATRPKAGVERLAAAVREVATRSLRPESAR